MLLGTITPQYEDRLRGLDLQAMVAYLEPTPREPSYVDALSHMSLPCLLYAGERDVDAQKSGPAAVHQMPDARFVSLPGLKHVGAGCAVVGYRLGACVRLGSRAEANANDAGRRTIRSSLRIKGGNHEHSVT